MSSPKVMLIDDDPTYCMIMKKLADNRSIDLSYICQFDKLPNIDQTDVEVLIIDYDLGPINGVELSEYISSQCKRIPPIVYISQTERKSQDFDETHFRFINKKHGPSAVLKVALEFANTK